jgi:hypothetical protein
MAAADDVEAQYDCIYGAWLAGHPLSSSSLVPRRWRRLLGADPRGLAGADWRRACANSALLAGLQPQELLWQYLQKYFSSMTIEMQPDGRLQNGAVIPDGSLLLFRLMAKGAANHLGIAAQRAGRPSFIHACHVKGVCEVDLTLKWRRRAVAIFRFPKRGF